MRAVVPLAVAVLFGAAGCFSALPVTALGYRCDTDGDCGGVQLRCQAHVCAADPARGDGGFPTAQTTGVPSAVAGSLTPSGPLTINGDGGLYDLLDIAGCVVINGNGVTLRRSRIRCDDYFDVQLNGLHTTLEDLEIDGQGNADANGVSGDEWTATRLHVHSQHQPFLMGNHTQVTDSYAHDFYKAFDAQSGHDLVIEHNTVDARPDGELGVDLDQAFGALSQATIHDNLFYGGNFGIAVAGTDIVITDNVFAGDQTYGPITLGDGGFTITGNVYLDGGVATP